MVRNLVRLYCRAYRDLPREISLLLGPVFINRFGTMVVPFFSLYVTSELGFQEAAAGHLLSVYGCGSICGAYACGRLIRSLGAVRLQILFLLCSVPACLIVPWMRSWWSIAAAMF